MNSRENAKMKPKGNVEKGEKHYRRRKEVKENWTDCRQNHSRVEHISKNVFGNAIISF